MAPNGLRRVCLNTSGSEATETMVKFAWSYHAARGQPERRKVISRNRGFHGSTIVAASMSGLPDMHLEYGLPLPGFIYVRCPDLYREGQPGESRKGLRSAPGHRTRGNDRAGRGRLDRGLHSRTDPGGRRRRGSPADYFPNIQAVLDKHGILMLDDEVVCGFGRTGNWFS